MTIGQLPSGSWRVRWFDPDGRRRCRTLKTYEDAAVFEQAVIEVTGRGQPIGDVRPELLLEGKRFRVSTRGHYVYLLHDEDDVIVYVGRSSNILKRLGDHLHVRERRELVAAASIIRCETEQEMKQLETALIFLHQPALNSRGTAGKPRDLGGNSHHPLSDCHDMVTEPLEDPAA